MSDLFGNPEDRFSRVAAQLVIKLSHVKITTGFGLEIWEVYTLFSHDLTLNEPHREKTGI